MRATILSTLALAATAVAEPECNVVDDCLIAAAARRWSHTGRRHWPGPQNPLEASVYEYDDARTSPHEYELTRWMIR